MKVSLGTRNDNDEDNECENEKLFNFIVSLSRQVTVPRWNYYEKCAKKSLDGYAVVYVVVVDSFALLFMCQQQ